MTTDLLQLNMFGPPEPVSPTDPAAARDDAPVPTERELLWPIEHAAILGPNLLERLYGDIPRRTRLTVHEICRRLRCGHSHVYELVGARALDATDYRHPEAGQQALAIYRYSLVRLLFHREFVADELRTNLPHEDLDKCFQLAQALRNRTTRKERP
jgi:hypothetical protein